MRFAGARANSGTFKDFILDDLHCTLSDADTARLENTMLCGMKQKIKRVSHARLRANQVLQFVGKADPMPCFCYFF